MSDTFESLGMIFDTAVDGVSDMASDFLNGATQFFDSGAMDGTTPQVDTSAADTQAAVDAANNVATDTAASTADTQAAVDAANAGAITAPTGTSAPTPGVANSASTWFQSLTPGAQAILGKSVAGGAAGLMAALSQKHLLDEEKRREDQKREDKARRSFVPAISEDAFKPKAGIIDGARGG